MEKILPFTSCVRIEFLIWKMQYLHSQAIENVVTLILLDFFLAHAHFPRCESIYAEKLNENKENKRTYKAKTTTTRTMHPQW